MAVHHRENFADVRRSAGGRAETVPVAWGECRVAERAGSCPYVHTAPVPTARDVGDRGLGPRLHDPDDRLRHVRNVLWANLHLDALLYGAIWLAIGIILLVYMTRGLRQPLTMRIEEETLAEEGTPVPHVKHGAE
jgi:hypothetical protein